MSKSEEMEELKEKKIEKLKFAVDSYRMRNQNRGNASNLLMSK